MKRAPVEPGTLYLVATPIGNMEDITLRAVRVLGEVDLVAAEDTRSARVLLGYHGLKTRTISMHKDNEVRRSGEVVQALEAGKAVALISDAGMPGISDPGERLVGKCLERGLAVDVIPGASAVLSALILSGLPPLPFTFHGFLPRKGKRRKLAIERLSREQATAVIYESPRRTAATLAELAGALGNRPAALARELTKLYQEVIRLPLDELAEEARRKPPRGEVTLVVGGADREDELGEEELAHMVRSRLDQGLSPRHIADELSRLGRRRVYQLALALRKGTPAQ